MGLRLAPIQADLVAARIGASPRLAYVAPRGSLPEKPQQTHKSGTVIAETPPAKAGFSPMVNDPH